MFTVAATVGVQILMAGIVIGMYRQTIHFHTEKFNDHKSTLDRLQLNKLDTTLHEVEVTRIDGNIATIAHRVSNVDQRLHWVETQRKEPPSGASHAG